MAFKTLRKKFQPHLHQSDQGADSGSPLPQPSPPRKTCSAFFEKLRGRSGYNTMQASLDAHNARSHTRFDAAFNTTGHRPDSMESMLQTWTLESGPLEQPARDVAAQKILEAYTRKNSTLDLSNSGLTSLPSCLSRLSIVDLGLKNNRLSHLPDLPPRLKVLVADDNCITHLPPLPEGLTAMSVDNNRLSNLPWLPPSLMILNANGNQLCKIPELPGDAWSEEPNARFTADLRNNSFSQDALQHIHSYLDPSVLKRLSFDTPAVPAYLSDTQVVSSAFDTWVSEAPFGQKSGREEAMERTRAVWESGAVKLDFFGLGLTSLPDCLSKLKIEHINLGNNRLEALPELPPTLIELRVSNNALSHLPPLPVGLQSLDASGNKLSSLPDLPATLSTLAARNNKLTQLPLLPAELYSLDLGGNLLTRIPNLPAWFWSSGTTFRTVDLTQNRFSDAELRGFKAKVDNAFSPASRVREMFKFDAPTATAIKLCSIAHIKSKEDATAVIKHWKEMGVSDGELLGLQGDLTAYLQLSSLAEDEFNARHVADNRAERPSRAFFTVGSEIGISELRKSFSYLKIALPFK